MTGEWRTQERLERRRCAFVRMPETPLVLLADREFNRSWLEMAGDAVAGRLELSEDARDLNRADLVVFHLPQRATLEGIAKREGQIWVGVTHESDLNYPFQADPDWLAPLEVLASYHRSADIPLNYTWPARWEEYFRPVPAKSPDLLACAFISNGRTCSDREAWLDEIEKWTPVHHYGRKRRNRPVEQDLGRTTKLKTLGRYHFNLALENALEPDYVSEKWYDCLVAGCVPVYRGAPNIADFAPSPGSYISVASYGSIRELAEDLRAIAADPARYAAYFDWKRKGDCPALAKLHAEGAKPLVLRLAEWLEGQRAVLPCPKHSRLKRFTFFHR
jgi:alpha-1,3-fucosyltransferase 10